MKIGGVTICFNEEKMVKYVMPYWERIGIDKLIVWDNLSTDNTVEELKKWPFVEVRSFDTNGRFDDRKNSDLKEETALELKEAGYDWVYTGDFDEVIYCENPNFREELAKIEEKGGTVLCRDMIHCFRPDEYEFDPSKLIHEQMTHFLTWHDYTHTWGGCKVLLHNTKQVPHVQFSLGAHACYFKGKETNPVLFGYPFITFHLKYVDWHTLEKNSHDKHDRIQWRLDVPSCTIIDAQYTKRLYSRTIGWDKIQLTIDKLIKKCKRCGATTWDECMKRYNDEFKVNMTKWNKVKKVKRLEY